jgi:fumarate hydratase class II
VLQSITILGNAVDVLSERAIAGFTVNRDHVAALIERNPILVTALNPIIGYEKAAEIAKKAYAEGRRVRDVASEATGLSQEELQRLLDPRALTEGGISKA